MSILKNSSETDQRFNTMVTTMEMFIKDGAWAGVVSQKDQQLLRAKIAEQYLDFDRQAWWWSSRLPTEAKLLKIDVDSKLLNNIISDYRVNIITAARVLRGLWEHCHSKRYKATEAKNKQTSDETRRQLDFLSAERQSLIGKLVLLFAPSEAGIQHALSQE